MTPEEVEKLKADAAEAEKLKTQLADKDKEIEGLRNKDQSFAEVRDMLKKSNEERDALTKKVDDLTQSRIDEPKKQFLDVLAGSDEELRKNLESKFQQIAPNAKTREEIEAGMKDAYMLVTKRPAEDVIRTNQSSASGIRAGVRSSAGTVDEKTLAFAKEFNRYGAKISEDDLKKRAK